MVATRTRNYETTETVTGSARPLDEEVRSSAARGETAKERVEESISDQRAPSEAESDTSGRLRTSRGMVGRLAGAMAGLVVGSTRPRLSPGDSNHVGIPDDLPPPPSKPVTAATNLGPCCWHPVGQILSQEDMYHVVEVSTQRVVCVRKQLPHFEASHPARENMGWATSTEEVFEMAYLLEL